jgi:hypothetical protein
LKTSSRQAASNRSRQAKANSTDCCAPIWRVLALCHQRRNLAEYEGHLEIDDQLLAELIAAADLLQKKVEALAPI